MGGSLVTVIPLLFVLSSVGWVCVCVCITVHGSAACVNGLLDERKKGCGHVQCVWEGSEEDGSLRVSSFMC